jgi:hypothetical protein
MPTARKTSANNAFQYATYLDTTGATVGAPNELVLVPGPSSTVLGGLGALALILFRRAGQRMNVGPSRRCNTHKADLLGIPCPQ